MDIEKLINCIISYVKKISYCLCAYLIGINIIRYGFLKTLFIALLVIVAYFLSNERVVRKIKQIILNKLEDR